MNNIDNILKRYNNKDEILQLRKWLDEYIVLQDEDKMTSWLQDNIKWLELDYKGMKKFLEENYIDGVGNHVGWYNSMLYNVLGMKYLAYSNIVPGFSYLIGVIPNKIGKQTIVASLCYEKERKWSMLQEEPVNSIQMIETNKFYRKHGIFNMLIEKIFSCLNPNLDLVVTDEYDDGLSCHTVLRLKNVLLGQGFEKEILTRSEYHEREKQKKLEKINK